MSKIMEDYGDEREKQGFEKGSINTIISLFKDKLLFLAESAKRLNLSEEEFLKLVDEEKQKSK